uniref:Uncharacterized protein n=1 Tax=Ananas comosus var. bracteatus TaxID=296719 RepID=A0A6V7QD04_ANACO|nr:unnamed protein product [Ananas comosus var. bracteatus]
MMVVGGGRVDLPLLRSTRPNWPRGPRTSVAPFRAQHPPSAFPLLFRFLVSRLSDPAVSPASADYRRLCSQFSRLCLFRPSPLFPSLSLLAMLTLPLSAVLLVRLSPSPLAHLLSGALVGLLWIQSGWMGHDSGHYPILEGRGPGEERRARSLRFERAEGSAAAEARREGTKGRKRSPQRKRPERTAPRRDRKESRATEEEDDESGGGGGGRER